MGADLGYTFGMKTAISISDDLIADAERLAKKLKKSRSQLYCHALREYVARHEPDEITETLNEVCADLGEENSGFISLAARRTLQ